MIEVNLLPGQGRLRRDVRAQKVTCMGCGRSDCVFYCNFGSYVSPHDPKLSMWDRLWEAFRRDETLKAARQ